MFQALPADPLPRRLHINDGIGDHAVIPSSLHVRREKW